MSTLEEMSQFTISELSDFTVNELNAMSYETLLAAVRGKYALAKEVCREDAPLTDAQIQMIEDMIRKNASQPTFAAKHPWITSIATSYIKDLISYCYTLVEPHMPAILELLKNAYILLTDMIRNNI